jgi:hypothetical protein
VSAESCTNYAKGCSYVLLTTITQVLIYAYVYICVHVTPLLLNTLSQGLGLLSAGLSALARSSGAQHHAKHSHRSLPPDRQIIVLFVVGGFTPQELQEVCPYNTPHSVTTRCVCYSLCKVIMCTHVYTVSYHTVAVHCKHLYSTSYKVSVLMYVIITYALYVHITLGKSSTRSSRT